MFFQILTSLEENSNTRNIADLTHALISSTRTEATLQHYIRIAFIVSDL